MAFRCVLLFCSPVCSNAASFFASQLSPPRLEAGKQIDAKNNGPRENAHGLLSFPETRQILSYDKKICFNEL